MLSLTRKADYALVALVFLGDRQRRASGPVSARLVADSLDLPQPVLMNTLKTLARAGLVASQRGVTGGYELARPPERVTLLEVVQAVEQPGDAGETQRSGAAALGRLRSKLDAFLGGLTIADLLDAPAGDGREAAGGAAGELVALRTADAVRR